MAEFFDTFQDAGGGLYVGADEKSELIDNGVEFPITSVRLDEESKFGTRYVVTVALQDENDEEVERLISFPAGTVESRDRLLSALEKFLEDPSNEPPLVFLDRVGRSILIKAASEKEVVKPAKKTVAKKAPARRAATKK